MDDRGAFAAFAGLQLLILIAWVAPVVSQDGFLSIDCGSETDYIDQTTGIRWVTDVNYTSTGKNAENVTFRTTPPDWNLAQAGNLRYFDEGRSRDCYVLPTVPQRTYLVRPSFYYGSWGNETITSSFDVYLNATLWFSYNFSTATPLDGSFYYEEAIVYSPGRELNFCLVPQEGPSFISVLELRELGSGMYSDAVGPTTSDYLSLYSRDNCGASKSDPPFLRYPEDNYDRFWTNPSSWDDVLHIQNTSLLSSSRSSGAPDLPPLAVMQDAWVGNYPGQDRLWFENDFDGPVGDLYVAAYFQELDGTATATDVRGMTLYVDDEPTSSFNSSNQPLEIYHLFRNVTDDFINMSVVGAKWSGLPPILNAFEMYSVYDLNTSATAIEDVNAVTTLQVRLNLTDWTGDPCAPVPFDWMSCGADLNSSSLRVTNLNLSYRELAIFPTNLKELNNLTVLDFSHNRLSDDIGDFLGAIDVETVRILNLDRNLFSGTLNLSGWHASLLSAIQGHTEPSALHLVSLVYNNITDVYDPKLDHLTPAIETVLRSGNTTSLHGVGILLGGNPWCEQAKSKSLAQQYLCRVTLDDILVGSRKSKWSTAKIAVAVATSVGAFMILVSCICLRSLLKLRKQNYALLEIQEALSKQKVQPPFYSYAELRAATRDFCPENKLGQGAFGAVYKAVLSDGTILAVKKLFPSNLALTEFLNEAVLITGIKHRNLVQLKGCCIREKERMLVYEYAEKGNLAEALWDATNKDIQLDWWQRCNICVGVSRGLAYLHEELQPRIIHRDIKPANILMDKNLNAKIADFGLARPFWDDQSQAHCTLVAGTPGYVAPEYASQGQLTEKIDVFSFGVLMLEIVSGRKCIDTKMPVEKVYLLNWTKNLRSEGRLLDLLEPTIRHNSNEVEAIRVINIALLCVHQDPTRRPTMSHVVTMLVGTMDVTVFLDMIPLYKQPDYSSLLIAPENSPGASGSELSIPTTELQTVSEEYPLMNLDLLSSNSTFSKNRGGSVLMSRLRPR